MWTGQLLVCAVGCKAISFHDICLHSSETKQSLLITQQQPQPILSSQSKPGMHALYVLYIASAASD
jgi:hypothetical protein